MEKDIEQQQENTLRKKVYIKGIPDNCPQATLVKVFSQFGNVERAFTLFNHKSNTSRGFGFVEFSNRADAEKLIGKTVLIDGKEVYVSKALERAKGVGKSNLEKTKSECSEESRTATTFNNIKCCKQPVFIKQISDRHTVDARTYPRRVV